MKRSELNQIMRDAVEFIQKMNFKLPPFAFWSPEDWAEKGSDYNEIRDNMLGWDITDFGSGDYRKIGLLMFTIRNGNFNDPQYVKPYAEKLLIVEEEQITPYHFHWSKMEDIINRGGGNLMVKVYNSTEDEKFADTPVKVMVDGTITMCRQVPSYGLPPVRASRCTAECTTLSGGKRGLEEFFSAKFPR